MSEEPIAVKSTARRVVAWIVWTVLGLFLLLVLLLFSIRNFFVLQAPFHFLFGWLMHAIKTIPPLLGNWRSFLLPLGCLVLAGILIHRFVRRWLDAKGDPRRWRPADTVASMSLLLLSSGAAIALSGIVHQSIWLMSGPWFEDRSRRGIELIVAQSNARLLIMGLTEFHEEKGNYPNSLQEIEGFFNGAHQLTWVKSGSSKIPEPFILLHPGGTRAAGADEPLIVSPVIQSAGKFVVGYGDGSVRSLSPNQLGIILAGEVKKTSIR